MLAMPVSSCSFVPCLALASLLHRPQTPHASQGVMQSQHLNSMVLVGIQWGTGGTWSHLPERSSLVSAVGGLKAELPHPTDLPAVPAL